MNLVTIEKSLFDLKIERSNLHKEFEQNDSSLKKQIDELERLKKLGLNNFDLNKVSIAERILEFDRGFKRMNAVVIRSAINDIVNDFIVMRSGYFGVKDYAGFANQPIQCQYGYGPSHGYVVFSIGMKRPVRQEVISDEEKDACIYYLNHLMSTKEFLEQLICK